MEHQLLIGGQWVGGGTPLEVRNKYSGVVIGTLPTARRDDVDAAIAAAQAAAPVMAELPAHQRAAILARTAEALRAQRDDLARTIAALAEENRR